MVALWSAAPFAAIQFGVISIAAVLWLELRREERRLRLVRSLQTMLDNETVDRQGENFIPRAA